MEAATKSVHRGYPVIFPGSEVSYSSFVSINESGSLEDDNDSNKIDDDCGSANERGLCSRATFQFQLFKKISGFFVRGNAFGKISGTRGSHSRKHAHEDICHSVTWLVQSEVGCSC